MVLLDSNACIALLNRPEPQLARLLIEYDAELTLCSVVKEELWFGARNSSRVQENLLRLQEFFAAYPSVPFDDAAAEQHAALRAHLKRLGTPIGAGDSMIAAIALVNDAAVVTRNVREFERVPGLRLETW